MIYTQTLERAFRYDPERPAMRPGGQPISYRELRRRVERRHEPLERLGAEADPLRLLEHLLSLLRRDGQHEPRERLAAQIRGGSEHPLLVI